MRFLVVYLLATDNNGHDINIRKTYSESNMIFNFLWQLFFMFFSVILNYKKRTYWPGILIPEDAQLVPSHYVDLQLRHLIIVV